VAFLCYRVVTGSDALRQRKVPPGLNEQGHLIDRVPRSAAEESLLLQVRPPVGSTSTSAQFSFAEETISSRDGKSISRAPAAPRTEL
jgi:hypothetical protein